MNQKGVTLVELIIVIVIIGVISSFTIPTVSKYLGSTKKEDIYNSALVIEKSAESYCLINTCKTDDVLTSVELGEYISNLKPDYEYSVTVLDNQRYAVSYYKEGELSFPSTNEGTLVDDLVPSYASVDFVNLYGVATSSESTDESEEDEDVFTPPAGEAYITLVGGSTVYVELAHSYTEYGYNAFASDGSTITNKWNSGMGSTWSLGTKTITYDCYSQVDGKSCLTTTRYVVIVDTTPPEVHVNGSSTVNVSVGGSFTDYWGAWAYDLSNTSGPVTKTSNVNTSVKGTYQITYYSTDSSGNTGQAVRTVIVS